VPKGLVVRPMESFAFMQGFFDLCTFPSYISKSIFYLFFLKKGTLLGTPKLKKGTPF
jgi:hypothetical protein